MTYALILIRWPCLHRVLNSIQTHNSITELCKMTKKKKKQQISLKTENHSILRIRNELNWIILLWGWMNKRFLGCICIWIKSRFCFDSSYKNAPTFIQKDSFKIDKRHGRPDPVLNQFRVYFWTYKIKIQCLMLFNMNMKDLTISIGTSKVDF